MKYFNKLWVGGSLWILKLCWCRDNAEFSPKPQKHESMASIPYFC